MNQKTKHTVKYSDLKVGDMVKYINEKNPILNKTFHIRALVDNLLIVRRWAYRSKEYKYEIKKSNWLDNCHNLVHIKGPGKENLSCNLCVLAGNYQHDVCSICNPPEFNNFECR